MDEVASELCGSAASREQCAWPPIYSLPAGNGHLVRWDRVSQPIFLTRRVNQSYELMAYPVGKIFLQCIFKLD